ncbi:MAG: hypothetical protein AAGG75_19705 [Bacteroidota bacterium]
MANPVDILPFLSIRPGKKENAILPMEGLQPPLQALTVNGQGEVKSGEVGGGG